MSKRNFFHIFKGAVENAGEVEGKKQRLKAEQGRTRHRSCVMDTEILSAFNNLELTWYHIGL